MSFVERICDVPHRARQVQPVLVRRRDPGALLTPMLERVEAEIGHVGRFGVPVDPEDATFVFELVHNLNGGDPCTPQAASLVGTPTPPHAARRAA